MCHLVLLMPMLALPVLWLTPLSFAAPFYAAIVLISALLYWRIVRAMRSPARIGVETLIGSQAEVVADIGPGHRAQYLVRADGELWSARCAERLDLGEAVQIAAMDGINLVVKRSDDGGFAEHAEAKQGGRRCH